MTSRCDDVLLTGTTFTSYFTTSRFGKIVMAPEETKSVRIWGTHGGAMRALYAEMWYFIAWQEFNDISDERTVPTKNKQSKLKEL
jgi:hypothetical protein